MRIAFPFTAIVGQDDMKLAMLIAATDPGIGGVMVFGDRGTGKSTVAAALAQRLGCSWWDADVELERRVGTTATRCS